VAPAIGLAIGNAMGYSATFFAAAALIIAAVVFSKAVNPSVTGNRLQRGKEKLSLQSFISKEALIFSLLAICISGSSGIENSFVVLYGKSLGMANVGWYFSISAFALFFARIAFGKFADRHGLVSVLYPGIGIISLAMMLLRFADAGNVVTVFIVASAMKAIGTGAIQPALQASCLQGVDEKRRGAASCTYYLGADIGQGFAPIFAGVVASRTGYGDMFAFFSIPLLISAALYWFYINKKKRAGGMASAHSR
jgi:predicted MFS family arabinose efflux permease